MDTLNTHAGSPRTRRARWLVQLGAVSIVAGVGLLVTVGVVVARDYVHSSRVAELQSHRPIETGGGVPQALVATPTMPVESVVTPSPPPTPSVTSGDVPLLAPLDPITPGRTPTAETSPEQVATPATSSTPTPLPTPTPPPQMPPATHISIPAVGIDTDIVEITPETTEIDGQRVTTWPVADYAAGHHATSADPGEGGNIVMAGHDDYHGEVFRGLHDIQVGHEVTLTTPAGVFTYVVTEIYVRKYRGVPLEEQLAIGIWMDPMPDERLTLITCWPYGIDDHRVIVVAKPALGSSG